MKIIYCSDPFDERKPDMDYQNEADAAEAAGFQYEVVNYEALVNDNDVARSVRRVATQQTETLAVYRGWMLRPEKYAELYSGLKGKGIRLINDPQEYVHCHYLPESYRLIEGITPRSVWTKSSPFVRMDEVMRLLQPFDSKPIVVKDYVKSRKHEWEEACYISSASDRNEVERVVSRFVELQDEDLNEGLVFREFVEFEPLGKHSKSEMPLTKEYRIFWLYGESLYWSEYWEEGEYDGRPPIEQFADLAGKIQSHFFTMDVARQIDGDWLIVELGDGQVAGLPERADAKAFYKALAERAGK